MLANFSNVSAPLGSLNGDVQLPGTFRNELLGLIADELPNWRDDPERPYNTSETALTEHLCDYLTSVARKAPGWDILQFRTEAADEQMRTRKLDIAPKPCGAVIWIEGRRHTQYDPLLPIECKRLPSPRDANRDEREYVFSKYSSTGGIQRFKLGLHGAGHTVGGMIAYVQEETAAIWDKRVTQWIEGLIESGELGWTTKDLIELERAIASTRITLFHSSHARQNGLSDIKLRHLWIEMN